jgi:hypothetical protein
VPIPTLTAEVAVLELVGYARDEVIGATHRRLTQPQKSVSFHSRSFSGSATRTVFMLEHQTYSFSAKIGKSIGLNSPLEGSDSVQMTTVVL